MYVKPSKETVGIAMPFDLWGVLIPVIASTVILVGGAWVVKRYAGPAQAAYVSAVEGRMKILASERDELVASLKRITDETSGLRATINELERQVKSLERQVRDLTAENLELLRVQRAELLEGKRVQRATALAHPDRDGESL
jgi:septal ring factor EnvC (AmiA/AmiB activator)